jgi:hypothetical protein
VGAEHEPAHTSLNTHFPLRRISAKLHILETRASCSVAAEPALAYEGASVSTERPPGNERPQGNERPRGNGRLRYSPGVTGTPTDLMGRPTSSAWREEALARAAEMSTLLVWLEDESPLANKEPLIEAARSHLFAAYQGAHEQRKRLWRTMSGSIIERTFANLDAAEANLLRLAPIDYVESRVPNLLLQAQQRLPPEDPRLTRIAVLANKPALDHFDRIAIVEAIRGAAEEGRRSQMRIRNFRNVILFTAIIMMILGIAIATIGFFRPEALPLCFQPQEQLVVCPTAQEAVGPTAGQPAGPEAADIDDAIRRSAGPWDLALVEFVGLLGAAVAAAVALRGSRGSSDPYSIPAVLAILKISTGALTAVLGLLLIRAEFIPGLSALDSSAQIIAWAIVLGYAQQLFTRAIDQQARSVLAETQEGTPRAERPGASIPPPERRPTPPAEPAQKQTREGLVRRIGRRISGRR